MQKNSELRKSIILNVLLKPVSMVISMAYAPMLLRYLGVEDYGLWAVISSTINWILIMDAGVGNGLRNRLDEAMESGDWNRSKRLVSTAYISISQIVILIIFIFILFSQVTDWSVFFNTTKHIRAVINVTFVFTCLTFVLSLVNTISFSIQRAEDASYRSVVMQLINLCIVWILNQYSAGGFRLLNIAVLTGFSSGAVYLISSLVLYRNYKNLSPSVKFFDRKELKNICGIGFKFFFLQLAGLILFGTDNLIITKLIDNEHVTSYNMVYKIFGLSMTVFNAILTPLWSGFTIAMQQNDMNWIKNTLKKMKLIWGLISIGLIIAVFIYKPVTDMWLQTSLEYDFALVPCMAVYFIVYLYNGIYATLLNGIGQVDEQLRLNIFFAIVNVPLSVFLVKYFELGSTGVCLGTIFVVLAGDIYLTFLVRKLIQ